MDPLVLSGLIGGGASLLGNIFQSQTSGANTAANIQAQARAQEESEEFNAQQAGINRGFQAQQVNQMEDFQRQSVAQQEAYQTQMSNTAYQRQVNDMKRAGLNPILAAGGGGGASTPSIAAPSGGAASGSTASISTPNVSNVSNRISPMSNLGQVATSAMGAAQSWMDMLQKKADVDQTRAVTSGTKTDNLLKELEKMRQESGLGVAERQQLMDKIQKELDAVHENDAQRASSELAARKTGLGQVADESKVFTSAVKQGADAALPIMSSAKDAVKYLTKPQTIVKPSATLNREQIEKAAGRTYGAGYSGSGSDFGFVGDGR